MFMPGGQGVEVYDQEDVKITVSGEAVIRGWRDVDSLWRVPLYDGVHPAPGSATETVALGREQVREEVNNLFDIPSMEQAIRFVHACCGFPTKATWLKAIRRGNFVGWPLVTVENVNKYFPESEKTQKGHINHQREGGLSTKLKHSEMDEIDTTSCVRKKEKDVYIKVIELKKTIYSDQTGRFPVTSSAGHKYIMLMVEIDSNVTLVEPMKSKQDTEMQRAYLALLARVR